MDSQHFLYLTFANHPKTLLKNLQREYEEVQKLLISGEIQGRYILHCLSSSNLESITSQFDSYKSQLFLFHYSGHAGNDLLALGGQQVRAEGIAHLLSHCPKLKLVVLNACATAGQVDLLLEKGVPVVIATNAAVDDEVATVFSEKFYGELANGDTIEAAFDYASAHVKTKKAATFKKTNRGIDGLDSSAGELRWGLFYREENESLLKTRLPVQTSIRRTAPGYKPNKRLFECLRDTLHQFDKDIKTKSKGEATLAVINSFPVPISEQLRKLFSRRDDRISGITLERIRQISLVYQAALEMLAFTMLSHLWDIQMEDEKAGQMKPLPDYLRDSLKDYFELAQLEHMSYDYIPLIRKIRQYFDERQVTYFVEELTKLKGLIQADEHFTKACYYLYSLPRQLQHETSDEAWITHTCREAEEKLCTVLSKVGFLYRYQLVSVRNIDVDKYHHHQTAIFKHTLIENIDNEISTDPHDYFWEKFTDSRSALLLKKEVLLSQKDSGGPDKDSDGEKQEEASPEGELTFLNLSPFVFDLNAFVADADIVQFCFFSHYDQRADAYHFNELGKVFKPPLMGVGKTVEEPIVADKTHYSIIREQFDAFRKLMLRQA